MHPDILDALRLALAHHENAMRRRGYAFGGAAYEEENSPANFYTPRASGSPTGVNLPPPPQTNRFGGNPADPGLKSGSSYNWPALFPSSGSGSNIPHPPPPPGPSGLLGMSDPQKNASGTPTYDWPFPYPSMGGQQWGGSEWGGGMGGGSGLKNGPAVSWPSSSTQQNPYGSQDYPAGEDDG